MDNFIIYSFKKLSIKKLPTIHYTLSFKKTVLKENSFNHIHDLIA
jgi:hypothetical protein